MDPGRPRDIDGILVEKGVGLRRGLQQVGITLAAPHPGRRVGNLANGPRRWRPDPEPGRHEKIAGGLRQHGAGHPLPGVDGLTGVDFDPVPGVAAGIGNDRKRRPRSGTAQVVRDQFETAIGERRQRPRSHRLPGAQRHCRRPNAKDRAGALAEDEGAEVAHAGAGLGQHGIHAFENGDAGLPPRFTPDRIGITPPQSRVDAG